MHLEDIGVIEGLLGSIMYLIHGVINLVYQ